jgi:asparagine synthase (glutamine-hydrolysing)
MDHELAEFTARLPVRMNVRGRSLRYIQMRLAERYLPQALLKRPKQGFSSALPYMLRDEYRLLFDRFLLFIEHKSIEELSGDIDVAVGAASIS